MSGSVGLKSRIGGVLAAGSVIAVAAVVGAPPALALTAQTITFNNPGPQNFGSTPTMGATASSGLPVSYGSSTPSVCTVGTTSGTVSELTVGPCTIQASQGGDATHDPATPVSQTFAINAVAPGPPIIGTATSGNAQATVNFTAPTFTGDGKPIVTYTATSTPGSHTGTCSAPPCTVTGLTNNSTYTFAVTATNSSNKTATSGASNSVKIGQTQTITFTNPGPQSLGTTPTLKATSTSGLAVSFTSSTPTVCTIASTGKLAFLKAGTCTISANQAGNATYVAASTVTQSFTVGTASAITVTSSTSGNASVYGQPVTFTATISSPVSGGKLQWSVNGTNEGSQVTLTTSTTYTFVPNPQLPAGGHVVKATYLGDSTHASVSGQVLQNVSKAGTTTTVQASGTVVSATVTPVPPGAGTPTGTVAFTVNGAAAGSATVGAGGVATMTVADVGQHPVSATYSGDGNFTTSIGRRAPVGPTVVPHVTSQFPKTRAGWHRSAVYVFFTCTPNTAPLVGSCPHPITVSRNGFGQSVTVTVTATDGGSTTVRVGGINIDKVAPHLMVRRHGRKLSCNSVDGLSGIASCVIHRHSHRHANRRVTVTWTAVARDHAGNTTTKRGRFSYTR